MKFNFKFFLVIFIFIFLGVIISLMINYDVGNENNEINDGGEKIELGVDFLACESLESQNLIDGCKLRLSICNDDDCYLKKARFERDEQLCYNIVNNDSRVTCTTAIKISSIKQRAVLEDNISICMEFESEEMVEFCYDNYYIAKRFNENNLEFCSKIKNEVIRNECVKEN